MYADIRDVPRGPGVDQTTLGFSTPSDGDIQRFRWLFLRKF